jgi:hypothetical protein
MTYDKDFGIRISSSFFRNSVRNCALVKAHYSGINLFRPSKLIQIYFPRESERQELKIKKVSFYHGNF